MILHKLLRGENAALYLPFGLSKLRQLERQYGSKTFVTQKYHLPGYDVEVELSPPCQYVRITATTAAAFEFATSGWPIQKVSGTQNGVPYESYVGCTVSVTVDEKGKHRATIKQQKRTANGFDTSAIKRGFQVDLVNEPVVHVKSKTGEKYRTFLFESWAPGSSHTGIYFRSTEMASPAPSYQPYGSQGPWTPIIARDIGYDVPWAISTNSTPMRLGYLRGETDWPRASSMQTVTNSTYGTRVFAISVDAYCQFSVFPIEAIEQTNGTAQNVPADHVITKRPSFPAWCTVPQMKGKEAYESGVNYMHELPEIEWKFNHLGTRAAAIVYATSPFENDTAYWSSDTTETPWTQAFFDDMKNACSGFYSRSYRSSSSVDANKPRTFFAPGIIEVQPKITLTGSKLKEFEVLLVTRVVRNPNLSDYCPVAVGFVHHDIKDVASAGALVSFDIERWAVKDGELYPWLALNDQQLVMWRQEFLSIKNIDTQKEVACYIAAPLVALDIPTLSFVLYRPPFTADQTTNETGYQGYLQYFGMSVYVNTKYKETLFPNTTYPKFIVDDIEFAAKIDGKAYRKSMIDADPRVAYVPLNIPNDGWARADMQELRRTPGYANYAYYHKNPSFYPPTETNDVRRFLNNTDRYKNPPPSYNSTLRISAQEEYHARWVGRLSSTNCGTESKTNIMFCAAPRWGWHMYSSLLLSMWWVSPFTTFYVHPNGTWAFWNNEYIFNRNPSNNNNNGFGTTIGNFDAARVEHIIFDRVKIVSGGKTIDTTFFDLYNEAVDALPEDAKDKFKPLTPDKLRASFSKTSVDITISWQEIVYPYRSGTLPRKALVLRAVWDGFTSYLTEPLILDTPVPLYSLPETPPVDSFVFYTGRKPSQLFRITLAQPWDGPYQDERDTPPPVSTKHVRFANPILLKD